MSSSLRSFRAPLQSFEIDQERADGCLRFAFTHSHCLDSIVDLSMSGDGLARNSFLVFQSFFHCKGIESSAEVL